MSNVMERLMLPGQRQVQIVEILSQEHFVDVGKLSEILRASPATVRRDLQALATRGLIARTHGGASLARGIPIHEPDYVNRLNERALEKRAIARVASQYVRDNDTIVLDVGTTTLELAKALGRHRNLTVFTASLPIALALANSDASIVLIGGTLRKRELSMAGSIAAQTISQFHFDKFFLGAGGVSVADGFTDFGIEDIEIKKQFLARSRQAFALADHTKVDRVSIVSICALEAVDCLITDDGAVPSQVSALRQTGLAVHLASLTDSDA